VRVRVRARALARALAIAVAVAAAGAPCAVPARAATARPGPGATRPDESVEASIARAGTAVTVALDAPGSGTAEVWIDWQEAAGGGTAAAAGEHADGAASGRRPKAAGGPFGPASGRGRRGSLPDGRSLRSRAGRYAVAVGPNTCRVDLPAGARAAGSRARLRLDLALRAYRPGRWIGSMGRGEEQFTHPQALAVGTGGRLYLVDSGNDRLQVLSDRGTYLYEFGGFALDPAGRLSESESQRFDEPADVVQTVNRDLYVTDRNNHRVVRLDRDGRFLASFGADARLRLPRGIASNSIGEVLVADTENDRVLIFDRDGRLQRSLGTYGWGPRQFRAPFDVSVDSASNTIYVADTKNDRVQSFDQFGRLLWVFSGPFQYPLAVRADSQGLVWVVDGRTRQVLRFAPSGRLLDRLAPPVYALESPFDVAETTGGRLLVVDRARSALLAVDAVAIDRSLSGGVPAVGERGRLAPTPPR
jgi:hypothetical protein